MRLTSGRNRITSDPERTCPFIIVQQIMRMSAGSIYSFAQKTMAEDASHRHFRRAANSRNRSSGDCFRIGGYPTGIPEFRYLDELLGFALVQRVWAITQ